VAALNGLDVHIRRKAFAAVCEAPAHLALQELRLVAAPGEFVAVVGPSGAGKSTLLDIVAGLDRDFDGELRLPDAHGPGPPVLGYVFQEPRLLPWRTVVENIELPPPAEERGTSRVNRLVAAMGLEKFRHAHPTRLSVGMSRRVGLARAFAVDPDLLLMDEPFVSIDSPTARRLRVLLLEVWAARPTTVLFATHDLRAAVMLADRVVFLSAAPGTAIAEVAVGIPRDRRTVEPAVEEFHRDLLRRHEGILSGVR
jgi:NitT/TauT family transport system ATP-binding protein